jgi:hypothetical protein
LLIDNRGIVVAKSVIIIGGVPTAALTARGAVELMCHDDGRKFMTTIT